MDTAEIPPVIFLQGLMEPPSDIRPPASPLRHAIRLCVWDGVLRVMGLSLTQGVFVAGFAAALGADERAMGILGAMPAAGQLLQVVSAQLIHSAGGRKRVFIAVTLGSALIWSVIAVIAFTMMPSPGLVWLFVLLYGINAGCVATRSIAWFDWIRDLIPARLRGRFFGVRNRAVLLAGIVLSVPGAFLVDRLGRENEGWASRAYALPFAAAVVFIALSLLITRRIEEPAMTRLASGGMWRTAVRNAWASGPFRRYFFYRLYFNFSVSLVGSLLTFYLLKELTYSKTFVATLGVVSTLLAASTIMLWGRLADRVGNRPAMLIAYAIKIVWIGLWVFVTRDSRLLLIVIHVLSAHAPGSALLHQNMLLKLVPDQGSAAAMAMFNAFSRTAAVVGPIVGGLLVHSVLPRQLTLGGWTLTSWQQLILISGLLRAGALIGLIWVREPQSMRLGRFVRALRRGFTREMPILAGRALRAEDEEEPGDA